MKTITNKFKIALVAVGLLAIGTANAQITTETDAGLNKDTGRKAGGTADDETSIRLIDNKGTIKYLQAKNGLTQITSTSAGNRTTTTWQLGGTLNNDTYIDVDGNTFALDGIARVDTTTETAADDTGAASLSSHGDAGATGYTLLVRDEATGATKKLLVSDLIQSGENEHTILAAQEGTTAIALPNTIPFAAIDKNVQVFRNGAKLRGRGGDYTLATAAGVTTITLVPNTTAGPQEWQLYEGDIIEYYYSK